MVFGGVDWVSRSIDIARGVDGASISGGGDVVGMIRSAPRTRGSFDTDSSTKLVQNKKVGPNQVKDEELA